MKLQVENAHYRQIAVCAPDRVLVLEHAANTNNETAA
jgi:hypothetical protein